MSETTTNDDKKPDERTGTRRDPQTLAMDRCLRELAELAPWERHEVAKFLESRTRRELSAHLSDQGANRPPTQQAPHQGNGMDLF